MSKGKKKELRSKGITFRLKPTTIKTLKVLAKKHKSQARTVETLIHAEAEKVAAGARR